MSERYSRLFTLPEQLYLAGAPVIIEAGALLLDNQNHRVLSQLKFKSISDKPIKALKVEILPMDTIEKPLGSAVAYQYLDLTAERDDSFAQKTPVPLPDASTRGFCVKVISVAFADNSVWENHADWNPLSQPKNQSEILDNTLLVQYQRTFGNDKQYIPAKHSDLWFCACGAVNHADESHCHQCKRSFDVLEQGLDKDTLKKDAAYTQADMMLSSSVISTVETAMQRFTELGSWRDSAEKVEACREQIAYLQEKAKREKEESERKRKEQEEKRKEQEKADKKKKTIIAAVGALVVLCIAAYFVVTNVIIPNNQYNEAVALMEDGQYKEALVIIEEIDSPDLVYNAAVDLFEDGRYFDASKLFSTLDGYKDSNEMLKTCDLESRYQHALKLMNSGGYSSAKSLFTDLGDYKDSAQKAEECLRHLNK